MQTFPTSLPHHRFAAAFLALTLVPGVWTLSHTPVADLTRPSAALLSGSAQRGYEQRFEQTFPLRDLARHSWTAFKIAALREVSEGAVLGLNDTLFTTEELAAPAPHPDFVTYLAMTKDKLSDHGITLFPVIVPDKARMMATELGRARSSQYQARYDLLLDQIASAGLQSIDLRPALSVSNSYMRTDTHWSPEGAAAAASAIATKIADLIPDHTTFRTSRTGTQTFRGDLIAFADAGPWQARVGPAAEQITTYQTEAVAPQTLGLFDAAPPPVALVGTSFSERADFHFLGFLKTKLRADVLSYAQAGRGPFTPMEQFLAQLTGASTADETPHIVIWEIPERYIQSWSDKP
ncbi:hypothetical protein [Thalassobius sp. Cn5-15]|uniref:alginate O-acetyltransferase AlgX-related protein n=1 Tax=Thalassobius sp. Cn5-15 TaxID=2917763 RepID=UPI001EF1DF92|nr:hypothetical protein [Thalassobius sp. Cn5-15]MCG7493019.1 hypothetical protein [Thalassobius sp. Cn5-15]